MISVSIEATEIEGLNIDTDALTRTVATSMLGMIRVRVHQEGKASDGSPIGTYSKGYLTIRSGQFKNAGKSDFGYYTRGKKAVYDIKSRKAVKINAKKSDTTTKGTMRKKYNLGTDPKVILSLTRFMQNDMRIIQDGEAYCIGYSNSDNFKKAILNEKRYKKPIWRLSQEENDRKNEIIAEFIKDAIDSRHK